MAYVGAPPGTLFQYAGTSAPGGYLVCDGSAISRTTYADLYAAIGTTYGAGNGSSTFNLPDLRGRVAVGQGTNTSVSTLGANEGSAVGNRRPQHQHSPHTHNVSDSGHSHGGVPDTPHADAGTGGTYGYNFASYSVPTTTTSTSTTGINISSAPSGTGNSNDPMDTPAYLVTQYIIKY